MDKQACDAIHQSLLLALSERLMFAGRSALLGGRIPRIDGNSCSSTAERMRRYYMRALNREGAVEAPSGCGESFGLCIGLVVEREYRGVAILAAMAATTTSRVAQNN
jgi:hypothetical protein